MFSNLLVIDILGASGKQILYITNWIPALLKPGVLPDISKSGTQQCRHLHSMNASEVCAFVNATDDCHIDNGYIDYTNFIYCSLEEKLLPLGMFILIVWWLFLFCGLGITADEFFCPALAVISKTLRLSHNVAGVTFLAFGNGAPDIFSAIAAIGNAKNGDAGLAIGALFGAGVFLTTIIAGIISIICPFQGMQRPFLRDVIFFLAAVFWSFTVLWDKQITQLESIGFILLYVFYVLVVVVGRFIHQKFRKQPSQAVASIQDLDGNESDENPLSSATDDEKTPLIDGVPKLYGDEVEPTAVRKFFSGLNPIDAKEWNDKRLLSKILTVFVSPIKFFLLLTVPIVNYEVENQNWNRYLNVLHCITGPMFGIIATEVGFKTLGSVFPVWALILAVSVILAVIVLFTSKNDQHPVYHPVFSFLGFIIAVIWIYCIANEVVNILQTFGVVFNISNSILGLTLLAWGNSIGDFIANTVMVGQGYPRMGISACFGEPLFNFIADTVMARQGYPRMGISACFGGPLFNLLLGIGIPMTIKTIQIDGAYQIEVTLQEIVLAGFLGFSLITSLIVIPLCKFKFTRGYGIFMIIFYLVFLAITMLTETNVITGNV